MNVRALRDASTACKLGPVGYTYSTTVDVQSTGSPCSCCGVSASLYGVHTQVLLCGGHASDPGLLCEWQVEAAKAVAAELENQPIEPSMRIVATLRSLFDPWVSKARPPDDASDCPICYSVANERGQTPQLACQTCSNMFHASCLFSWLRFQSDLTDGFDDDVDNGSRRRCCPICRSRVT